MSTPLQPGRRRSDSCKAFTIIEMLTVLAVIGILATLLFPLVGKARESARKAKTRVQFSQWSSAIEAFRQEYGHYPNFAGISGDKIDTNLDTVVFVQTLSGRRLDGTALVAGDPGLTAGNTKRIGFYSFGQDDLTPGASPVLQDAFGNTEIVPLLDRNYDGLITIGAGGDYASLPQVNGLSVVIPAEGLRAGVAFYSAGAGNTVADLVRSWE